MKFNFSDGVKTKNDKIIKLTAYQEQLSLFDVAGLINRFAINELVVIDETEKLTREDHYWFNHILKKALEDAKEGINWCELKKEDFLYLLEYPYFIKEKTIDNFLEERKIDN
jgi:hypothetical protein